MSDFSTAVMHPNNATIFRNMFIHDPSMFTRSSIITLTNKTMKNITDTVLKKKNITDTLKYYK